MRVHIEFRPNITTDELLETLDMAKRAVERLKLPWDEADMDHSLRRPDGTILGTMFMRHN